MTTKNIISRRNILKGLGASITLPFMESLVPQSLSAANLTYSKSPQRFACLFMPNGVNPYQWDPSGHGRDFELSPILTPLHPFKNRINVFSGLMNKHSISRHDGHYTKTANFLTSMPIARTVDANVNSGGISLDQLIANHVGGHTVWPSLQYGMDRIKSGVDKAVGFTRLYGGTISWQDPTKPCSREIDPRMAFDRLFRNYVPGKPALAEDPFKKSILDLVQEDSKSMKNQLGIEDRNKLGEYLEAVRSVEKRLDNQENLADFEAQITPDFRKELKRMDVRLDEWAEYAEGVDVTEKARLLLDIIVLAFWSDASRVASFMFGNSVSNRNYSFLDGVSAGFHSVSHHRDDPRQLIQYEKINLWHIQNYAYFCERLDSIREGDRTLLDNSFVLFGSGLRDGNRHSPYNLPIVLAGSGGNKIHTGQYLTYEDKTPLANLYLTMLHAYGIEASQFADSEHNLCELLV